MEGSLVVSCLKFSTTRDIKGRVILIAWVGCRKFVFLGERVGSHGGTEGRRKSSLTELKRGLQKIDCTLGGLIEYHGASWREQVNFIVTKPKYSAQHDWWGSHQFQTARALVELKRQLASYMAHSKLNKLLHQENSFHQNNKYIRI